MKKIFLALITVLLFCGAAFGAGPVKMEKTITVEDPEYQYRKPKLHDLSEGFMNFKYICIDGYVYISSYYKLSQLIERDEDGLPVPVECSVCKEKK